jgi:hypothetical protein
MLEGDKGEAGHDKIDRRARQRIPQLVGLANRTSDTNLA